MTKQRFYQRFGMDLGISRRFAALELIVERLFSLSRPVNIVETGCVRLENNWSGDGQSTVVWGWIVNEVGGSLTAIDLDPNACETAIRLVPNAKVICGDSVENLMYLPNKEEIDFLYLDSMDWDGVGISAIHHLRELEMCWDQLKPGAMIAVDDNFGDGRGKGQLIKLWLSKAGIMPILDSYVTVWEKPNSAPAWEEIRNANS